MASLLFPELKARKFDRIFICRVCKTRMRADPEKVRRNLIRCRKCGSKYLRPKKSEITLVASSAKK